MRRGESGIEAVGVGAPDTGLGLAAARGSGLEPGLVVVACPAGVARAVAGIESGAGVELVFAFVVVVAAALTGGVVATAPAGCSEGSEESTAVVA